MTAPSLHSTPDHLHVFIMAGGSGERFWPMSRTRTPKHLLRLLGDMTLLEMTARRMEGLVPWERVFVLTNISQRDATLKELPFLPPENVICEPAKRDTAPACALATGIAFARDPRAVCAVLPADSMIHNVPVFQKQLALGVKAAEEHEAIITFGVPPTHPATGFGYLHIGDPVDGVCRVLRFVEKPDGPTAEMYVSSKQYAWNAGMFVWRAQRFLDEARRLTPELAAFIEAFPAGNHDAYLAEKFPALPKISVDYAIMEQAEQVLAVKTEFDWDDVGSWTALPEHLDNDGDGNTGRGPVVQYASKNNVAVSNGRLIALCGVEDLIVVETADAILVCHRDAAQDIKKLQPLLPDELR